MPGPAPKDPAARRRRNASTAPGFKLLPHEGRQGPPPKWPLTAAATIEEEDKWKELWRLPQAVEWERSRDFGTVALYVRTFCEAALPGADPRLLAELRQLDNKIGVSVRAMRDLRWITDEPLPEEEAEPVVDQLAEMRKRVRAVE